jgi:3-methylcrotonyl-CoA carboxylase beta subunit
MCGRAYRPRFLWMWPNARISVMGGEQAASVLATVRRDGIEAQGRQLDAPRKKRRSRRRSARSTSTRAIPTTPRARLWDDGVIDPADTRGVLGARAVRRAQRADRADTRFGVFRM